MKKRIFLIIPLLCSPLFSCNNNRSEFNITWKNDDGTILKSDIVKKGVTPVYDGVLPTKKSSDASYIYKFNDWTPTIIPANADATYTATFRQVENVEVSFVNYDGTPLESETKVFDVESEPNYVGIVPSKPNDGETYYRYNGFKKTNGNTSLRKVTYQAQFENCSKDDDTDNDGLEDYLDPSPKDPSFKADISYTFDGSLVKDTIKKADFKLDFKSMFIDGDNNTYNKDLAKLALVTNCAFNGDAIMNEDIKPKDNYSSIFKRFKTDDPELRAVKDDSIDVNDCAYIRYVHKKVNNKDILFVVNMTSEPNNRHWYSNVDVGYKGSEYYDLEGDASKHDSRWINNSQYHKGFYVTANRIVDDLEKYIAEKVYDNPILFVTGYSRGGALANIVGNMMSNKYKTFTYTFAAPNTYFGDNDNKTNIYNFVNSDDVVPHFPLASWTDTDFDNKTPTKHGIIKSGSIADLGKNIYYEQVGHAYKYVKGMVDLLNEKIQCTRKGLYEFVNSGYSYSGTESEVDTKKQYYLDEIDSMFYQTDELKKYFPLIKTDEGGKYKITAKNCPGSILKALGNVVSNGVKGELSITSPLIDLITNYKNIAESLYFKGLTSIESVAFPHYLTTYYLLIDLI